MNGNAILIDTNIALYYLGGDTTIKDILAIREINLSFITELELLSYPKMNKKEKTNIEGFISFCKLVNYNPTMKDIIINIRKANSLKLPDAIIAASSIALGMPLITSDQKFKNIKNLDLIFYDQNI